MKYLPFVYILVIVLASCEKRDTKGLSMNNFRKAHGGILLEKDMENRIFSTDDSGKEGVSGFHITAANEAEFRRANKAYLRSKTFYFDSLGIYQEENMVSKVISSSEEWFMNTIDYYRRKEVTGFLILMKNGRYIPETEIKLDKAIRDSIFASWHMHE